MCFAPQRRALFRHLNFQKWSDSWCVLYILTWKCASRHNGVHFFDISTSKSGPTWCVLYILTSKCASRHNGVHFFDISTSKSGPTLRCFVHFDLEMCFAPQRRALFDISTSKSGPRPPVFNTFDFEMCFAPQRRAIFHRSVASWLRTRRFSEPTFRPSGATNHWKNTVFRDFPTFSRICIFCLLTLSLLIFSLLIFLFSLPLPCSAFHLSILSEV